MSVFTQEIEYPRNRRLGQLAMGRVAFVVDDVLPPWRARGVEVKGRAEVLGEGGEEVGPGFGAEVIRIFPERIVGWGIDSDSFNRNARTVG